MLRFTTNALLYMSAMNAGLAYNVPVTGTVKMQTGNQIPLRDPAFRNEHHDRQWALNIDNFRGKWKGSTYWFLRKDDKSFDFSNHHRKFKEAATKYRFQILRLGNGRALGFALPMGRKYCLFRGQPTIQRAYVSNFQARTATVGWADRARASYPIPQTRKPSTRMRSIFSTSGRAP
jgi:hypothetical protein